MFFRQFGDKLFLELINSDTLSNCTLTHKLQWNSSQSTIIFVQNIVLVFVSSAKVSHFIQNSMHYPWVCVMKWVYVINCNRIIKLSFLNNGVMQLSILLLIVYEYRFSVVINSSLPGQNVRHNADDIFKCIFLNENLCISIEISLKFVAKGPISNIPALVQIMAWRRPGDKPLSEPMLT